MRFVVCCAFFALSCTENKEEVTAQPDEPKPAAVDTKPAAVDTKPTPTPNQLPELPADLPDDLKQLAEMPPLTAEATPEEIERRVDLSVDALAKFFDIVSKSEGCDQLGESLSKFVAVNKRVFANLQTHLEDPKAARRVAEVMAKQGGQWIRGLGQKITKCATHPRVTTALMELTRRP